MPLFNGTNAPTLAVQINFNNTGLFTLGLSTLSATTGDVLAAAGTDNWTSFPITDVRDISIRRGRTRENQAMQPGTLTFTLDNWSGNYDPDNTSSTYRRNSYTMLTAGTEIRVRATWSATNYDMFYGVIEQVQTDLSLDPVVVITCVDYTAWVGRQIVPAGTSFDEQGAWLRIQAILSVIGYTGGAAPFGTHYNDRTLRKTTLAADTTAQELIDQCLDAGYGLWVSRPIANGDLYFSAFDDVLTVGTTITFSDQRTASTVEYDEIESSPGALYLINEATLNCWDYDYITFENAVVPVAITSITAGSQGRFGVASTVYDSEFVSSAALIGSAAANQALADYMAQANAYPKARITSIGWDCVGTGGTSAFPWVNLLQSDIGYHCTINRTTVDGRSLSYNCIIQAVNYDITPDSWRASFSLSPGT